MSSQVTEGDGEGRPQAARVAVGQGSHAVEAVGDVADPDLEGMKGLFVGGVAVAHAGDSPRLQGGSDEGVGAGQLRRQRDETQAAPRRLHVLAELVHVGRPQPGFEEGALATRVEERALQEVAQGLSARRWPLEEGGAALESAEGALVLTAGDADKEGSDAPRGDPAGVGLYLSGVLGEEGVVAAAVGMQLDEAGCQVAAAQVQDLGAGGRLDVGTGGGDAPLLHQQALAPSTDTASGGDEAGVEPAPGGPRRPSYRKRRR